MRPLARLQPGGTGANGGDYCQPAVRPLAVGDLLEHESGVDPAAASLDVARAKPSADAVRWIDGDATSLPAMQVDPATFTGRPSSRAF